MKRILYFGAAALGFLFTACQSDDINVPDSNDWEDGNQTLYVAMTISGDGVDALSRADETFDGNPDAGSNFQIGTGDENAINNVYFVFYDETGNVVGDIVPVDFSEWAEDSEIVNETVEKSYSSVVSVTLKSGEVRPSQVICYINPISPGSLNRHLNVIQTVARNTPYTTISQDNKDVKRFAMSNSVHYHSTDAGELPTIATKIDTKTQLFETEDAATKAIGDDEKTVNIYVERYATKLAFSAAAPTTYKTATRIYKADGTYDIKTVDLDFIPQYWALNAEANTTYVIKSFRKESESGLILADNYKYGELNNTINRDIANSEDQWQWNRATYHRSYWGMSPAYFTSEYPEVSSDLDEMKERGIQPNQTYIPYNKLDEVGFPASETAPQYFKETTVGAKALRSKNPDAAVAHVIYVGRYNLTLNGTSIAKGNGTNMEDAENPSFYTYLSGPVPGIEEDHPYVYFDNVENSAESKIPNGESMLKRFFAQTTILYKKQLVNDKETYIRYTISNPSDLAKLTSALEVSEVSKEVKENYNKINNTSEDAEDAPVLKLQNNTRTLQFKSVADAKDIYILTGDGYCSITDSEKPGNNQISLLEANITLMRQVGYSYYYTLGHAYFNIPVKHFGWYRKGNDQRTSDQINWSLVRVGDFGMVRNHSYSINVSKIIGLAKGIGDDNNPIVPPSNSRDYYMAYSVRVLKWAVVPAQSVEL